MNARSSSAEAGSQRLVDIRLLFSAAKAGFLKLVTFDCRTTLIGFLQRPDSLRGSLSRIKFVNLKKLKT